MISKSPKRNTFQKEKFLERQAENGLTPENDENTKAMFEMYESFNVREDERESDLEWRKNNLEWDLRTTDWILAKARASESYAQNIYAALCNNEFIKLDILPILKEELWSCSWRYAGGIVANMRQEGDYIDWYCSGIRDTFDDDESEDYTKEQLARLAITKKYVPEGMITPEIRKDFKQLGWIPAKGGDWEQFDDKTDNP